MTHMPISGDIQDTAAVYGDGFAADSLSPSGEFLFPVNEVAGIYRDVPPAEVFGQSSYIVSPGPSLSQGWDPFSGDILWQLAILALLAVYTYVIFRYMPEAGQLLRLMVARKKEGRSSDDFQGVLSPFVNTVTVVSLFSAGIAIVRIIDVFSGGGYEEEGVPLVLLVIAAAALFGITGGLKHIILKAVGVLTFSEDTVAKLMWQKRIFIVTLTIVATPLVLMMSLAPARTAIIFAWLLLGIAGIMLIWFAYKTMRLFIGQKISILFWILYLCVVELMPYGIVALALLRRATV